MRMAKVLYKQEEAGSLIQHDDGGFEFNYLEDWLNNPDKPAISLTLPKSQQTYQSPYLFPFFYNMLPEGTNRQVVCTEMRLDTDDYFGILLTTAAYDTIGAITLKRVSES
ncbi:serine/threonine-protein kinase HipA [Leeuwenhoekiella polynyae]|uniref:Serine/threonine-protein kinase HipA n=2 Tax=Leeuwenhoekiella polynyae TaxID=1550906 RepID=A0A4Q0P1H9_9FLAO|nr:serine/threonine-protein kinase HipA [Leeuwenhoekiella polynyae]|tara:strand:+ start:256 stop:585 length:330 start_codon:yes stop_codon:yes gene_type:complete